MMNCGYDPAPGGKYDLPPIAPQMWHAYHIAGEQLALAIIAALLYRWRTGKGQQLSCAIHEAVAKSTEVDLMTWVMRRALVLRQTCRHARETVSPHPSIAHTKDGRWVMANLGNAPRRRSSGSSRCSSATAWRPASTPSRPPRRQGGRFVPGTGPEQRDSAITAWRPCSASCARSRTRTFPGGKRRRRGCSGRRCASRTRTPSIRTGSRGRAAPTSSIPSWAAPSATPRANGSAPRPPGRSAGGRRC